MVVLRKIEPSGGNKIEQKTDFKSDKRKLGALSMLFVYFSVMCSKNISNLGCYECERKMLNTLGAMFYHIFYYIFVCITLNA